MLLLRSLPSFMNAKAATRAVAAVPLGFLLVGRLERGVDGGTHCVLETCYWDLSGVEALAVVPEDFGYSDGLLCADCSGEGGEVVVGAGVVVFISCTWVFVHGKRTVEENEGGMVLLVK